MSLFFIVALPFFGALLPGLMNSAGRAATAGVTFTVTLAAFVGLLTNLPSVLAGEVVMARVDWMPLLGLNFSLMLDGLGFFFALLILGIGLLIIAYARYYLSRDDNMGEFFTYLLLFQGAMVGIVLSDNILLLLVFWELTSLSSFLLDRLLEASARRAPGRAHGIDRHRHGRSCDDRRHADPWSDCRQL